MTIYVIANRKGGVGKTTTAVNLASYLATKGSVLLVDADDQKSAFNWHKYRETKDIACEYLQGDLEEPINQFKSKYDNIVIDVAGRDSLEFRTALFVADKLFIPTQTSQFDLDVLDTVTAFIDEIQKEINPKLKKYMFISRASTNAKSKDADEVSEYLADKFPSYHIMKARFHERVQFKDSAAKSLSVLELPSNKAKDDFFNWLLEAI